MSVNIKFLNKADVEAKLNKLSNEMKVNLKVQLLDKFGKNYERGLKARVHKITGKGANSIQYVRTSNNNGELRGNDYLLIENARGSSPTKPPFNNPPHDFINIVVNELTPSLVREAEIELQNFLKKVLG